MKKAKLKKIINKLKKMKDKEGNEEKEGEEMVVVLFDFGRRKLRWGHGGL